MTRLFLSVLLVCLPSAVVLAQHEHHQSAPAATPTPAPQPPIHQHGAAPAATVTPVPAESPHTGHDAPASAEPPMQQGEHMQMNRDAEAHPPEHNLFQSDMSLMTGMTPRDSMGGMAMPGWHFMVLGVGRVGYNHQGGASGDDAVESSNWIMVHAAHDLGGGRLSLMLMNSFEPWTFEKRGSPELFQTGESLRGRPLVDRQHPHDLFMNLSATYRFPLGSDGAAWIQLRRRRARHRSDRFHAPGLVGGKPDGAARPPLGRLLAHHVQRRDRGRRLEVRLPRGLGLPRSRARRGPARHRGREYRFRGRPAESLTARGMVRPAFPRVPARAGGRPARESPPHDRVSPLRSGRGSPSRRDPSLGSQQRDARRVGRFPSRGGMADHAVGSPLCPRRGRRKRPQVARVQGRGGHTGDRPAGNRPDRRRNGRLPPRPRHHSGPAAGGRRRSDRVCLSLGARTGLRKFTALRCTSSRGSGGVAPTTPTRCTTKSQPTALRRNCRSPKAKNRASKRRSPP